MVPLLLEYDSRVQGFSVGSGGVTKPRIASFRGVTGLLEVIYCLNCGKRHGAVTVGLPPGVIFICPRCDAAMGPLPLSVVNFTEEDA